MLSKLVNNIIQHQLANYVSLAKCIGRIGDRREALMQLVDLLGNKQGGAIQFFKRTDSRFFIAEFDGVRLMTVYENKLGDLEVEVINQLPESAASLIHAMLGNAIQIKTLEWHIGAIDSTLAIGKRNTQMLNGFLGAVNGNPSAA